MPVRLYQRSPIQLILPGFKPNPLRGLKLTKDKLKVLDGELCDVATRNTRGRLFNAFVEDALRTPFERDVQRIGVSEVFQRLKDKTQVFPLPIDPVVRNRFTHSIEVARISRSIATILRLNPDLAEAIGLAHDLGHSPFGHAGEEVLKNIRHRTLGLYHKHNVQGLTIIDDMYRNPDTGHPLDLTFETRDGVVCHLGETTEKEIIPWGACEGEKPKDLRLEALKKGDISDFENHREFYPSTLEGCVARIADRIASIARDPEDAVRHGIITWKGIPETCQRVFGGEGGEINASSIIKRLVESVIVNSWDNTHYTIYSIRLGDEESEALKALFEFNRERIYQNAQVIKRFLYFVPYIIEVLYLGFSLENNLNPQEAINKISYMTDKEAMDEMNRIRNTKFKLEPFV